MERRQLFRRLGAFGLIAGSAIPFDQTPIAAVAEPNPNPLKPPAQGSLPVAFLISDGAVVIDFCGPWEVFQDVDISGRADAAFQLYTVAETREPIRASGGIRIIPDYTFDTAPAPKVLVIPAQSGRSEAMKDWIRKVTRGTDVTMSVCNGAFLLASTGLLSGRAATAHHNGYSDLAMAFPDIQVKRGVRFVEDGNIATAGGLSSGIDLALHVVERYYGREAARKTAYAMEYQGQGWLNPDSNAVYAEARVSTDAQPLCPVCQMDVDPGTELRSAYKGKTYYFCMKAHKVRFDAAPEKYL